MATLQLVSPLSFQLLIEFVYQGKGHIGWGFHRASESEFPLSVVGTKGILLSQSKLAILHSGFHPSNFPKRPRTLHWRLILTVPRYWHASGFVAGCFAKLQSASSLITSYTDSLGLNFNKIHNKLKAKISQISFKKLKSWNWKDPHFVMCNKF